MRTVQELWSVLEQQIFPPSVCDRVMFCQPASVALLDVHLTGDQEVADSTAREMFFN